MPSERERIVDLLLEKTRAERVTWGYRDAPPVPSIFGEHAGMLQPEEIYTATVSTEAGEIFAILRVGESPAANDMNTAIRRAAGRVLVPPLSLTVRDVSRGVELVITSEEITSKGKLEELVKLVRPVRSGEGIIEVLEKA